MSFPPHKGRDSRIASLKLVKKKRESARNLFVRKSRRALAKTNCHFIRREAAVAQSGQVAQVPLNRFCSGEKLSPKRTDWRLGADWLARGLAG